MSHKFTSDEIEAMTPEQIEVALKKGRLKQEDLPEHKLPKGDE